ncbi:ABC transporter ATP-binding protein [Bifidobacterium platyrrhinorum]|uniref:ATP-binding cassette domain-containing protein n=1 Tax=Bifidobacterium platyrrhinorum TaxID=2661628 RepID=A0A6L9SRL4_9BIFI|nr:ABC transporter ATP-binding protein [Bifidobacterium platyrrhinorum]NEG55187.1 ATP-binding cassette domain-containing protein [Bifidobacterium platyrrhinorum]
MSDALLELDGVSKTYRSRGGYRVKALDDVSLKVEAGRTTAIVGESGSGKTTLSRVALRIEREDAGSVRFHGRGVAYSRGRGGRGTAGKVQAVFQDPYGSFNPRFTIRRSLAEPLHVIGVDGEEAERRSRDALAFVGLPADSLDRYPDQFSGGQRQRICIARAIAPDPELIVLDEPTSALDVIVQAEIIDLLLRLQEERGIGYLYISHDLATVRHIADTIAVMHSGRIVEQGDATDVIEHPREEYTRHLIGSIPNIRL